jgi:lipoprotein-releasing system permease protein
MSRLPFELFMALRYLRPKRTFVSVITLISVIGVTLGVGVLVIVIAVMTGFGRQLQERIIDANPHLQIEPSGKLLPDYEAVLRQVAAHPLVRGAAPYVRGPVLLETGGSESERKFNVPIVWGVDPRHETNVSKLPDLIRYGEFDLEGRSLIIGTSFASGMDLRVGDRVNIWAVRHLRRMKDRAGTEREEAALPDEYTVRGIFDAGYNDFNANLLFTSLENAQELYAFENQIHGLQVKLKNPFQAGVVRGQLLARLGPGFEIQTWWELNAVILTAVMVEKNVMFYILFFIMIVAAFGIAGTLIAFVVHKTREVGILKALGAADGQIAWLFVAQSLFVGVVGAALGLSFGFGALAMRNEFLHVMNRLTGLELFPASLYQFTELPAEVIPGDVALIAGSAMVTSVLAGLIPAIYAARLRPVEALRHE